MGRRRGREASSTPSSSLSSSAPQPPPCVHLTPPPRILSPERDILEIVGAYDHRLQNPKYAFKHLLFSVTEPQNRVKFAGVSLMMWEEAMKKLDGMESADRERLWPELIRGFKDLKQRHQIQREIIVSDVERLCINQSNAKMLQRYFRFDFLTRIQRTKQKEHILQRRLLRIMSIVEALEGKGCCIPLTKGEDDLAGKLVTIRRQLRGSGVGLHRRVQNLLNTSRVTANVMDFGGSIHLPISTKIQEQSLADLQEILQQYTSAIARLGSFLKQDIRHVEIMKAKDT